jgi:hypothetical protein
MIILWKNIVIFFYKVDIENTPFKPDTVWHCTLKRFADLALAQAHEARTLQLRAISRGEDPPSLSHFEARLAPLASVGEEAELVFSGPLYDYLVEFNLERYTINRPKAEQQSILRAIRKGYQKWIPESKPNHEW